MGRSNQMDRVFRLYGLKGDSLFVAQRMRHERTELQRREYDGGAVELPHQPPEQDERR